MCGIYGFYHNGDPRVGKRFLHHAIATQRHRGPDGAGLEVGSTAGVAMTRLRIRSGADEPEPIPLSAGRFVAFNGEIYHDAAGSVPAGGKAEVQALLAVEAGTQPDGMYAVALLDRDSGDGGGDHLTLCRDPFGIKPLMMRESAGGYFFSSELGPLLSVDRDLVVRRSAIAQFLAFGRPLDGGGFLAGIDHVPGNGSIRIDRAGLRSASGGYYAEHLLSEADNPAPNADQLREVIAAAIAGALVSDRPVGVAVSGGLDSTIICAELNRIGVADLKLVSVVTPETGDGVTDVAALGLQGGAWRSWTMHQHTFEPETYLDELRVAIGILGEPTRMSSLPLYTRLAAVAAEAGVTTLLLGEGADEMFCGYRSYLNFDRVGLRNYVLKPVVRASVEPLLSKRAMAEVEEVLSGYVSGLPGADDWTKLRMSELHQTLEPLLRRADHALMRHSVEGRTPFLHGDVPRVAFRLTRRQCLHDGQTKVVLREAYADHLPRHFAREVKRHFRAPVATWFAGPLLAPLKADLKRGCSYLSALGINTGAVAAVVAEVATGAEEAANTALKLITIIYWMEGLEAQGYRIRDDRA